MAEVIIKVISDAPAGSNCYIVSSGKSACVIDPGCRAAGVTRYLEENLLQLEYIMLTHGHYDHIAGLDELRIAYPDVSVYAHADESLKLPDPFMNGAVLFGTDASFAGADRMLSGGERLPLGEMFLEVILTPGHTTGGICILCGNDIFTGDTLFKMSIGRTDLPGGNLNDIISSLSSLLELDDGIRVWPGHGPRTTIGYEKRNNPYIKSYI